MKTQLHRQLLLMLAFFAFQFGYAKESPHNRNAKFVAATAKLATFTPTEETYCQKTDQCFVFTYKGFKVSNDGEKVTLSFAVKNNCGYNLSCVSFELPYCTKVVPLGSCKYQYYTYIASQPFPCLKYVNLGWYGCKNGNEEVFCYTMLKCDFDKLKTIRIQAKTCNKVSTVCFDKDCNIPKCLVAPEAITNVTYTVNGVNYVPTSSNMSSTLETAVKQGKPVKICFTAPATTGYKTYSLVSYTSPYPVFVRAEADKQKVFDYKTVTVGPEGGNVCLEIKVPNCYYQVDFVKGCIIEKLGPADTNPNNFYTEQRRMLAHANDGTVACTCVPDKPRGGQGCNSGCWKQKEHYCHWSSSKPTGAGATKFFDVFTAYNCDNDSWSCQGLSKDLSMLDALALSGSDFKNLASQAAAAYLNSKDPDVKFGFSDKEVIQGVINAFKTGNSFMASQLATANAKGCPHGSSPSATTASIIASEKVGILGEQRFEPLSAYPNPFNDKAVVRFTMRNAENYTVSLYSVNGKQIKQLKAGSAQAGDLVTVDITNAGLSEGLYLVRLVTKSETQTLKLMLKR